MDSKTADEELLSFSPIAVETSETTAPPLPSMTGTEESEGEESTGEKEEGEEGNAHYIFLQPNNERHYRFKTRLEMLKMVAAIEEESQESHALFLKNQRLRMAFRRLLLIWRYSRWSAHPACNIDLIENEPVADEHAILLCDTRNRQIYRFHRRDIFNTLLTNLSQTDEMLPYPRPPTNPWTNEPLTNAQTIAVCKSLIRDFGRRGLCPPVLFAAFCASGYQIKRLVNEQSALLAQLAIRNCFKDLTADNTELVFESITHLLNDAGVSFTDAGVRRWIRSAPPRDQIGPWLELCRDYYLYINLHIQSRPRWYSVNNIRDDVRALYNRSPLPDMTTPRLRSLRSSLGLDFTQASAQLSVIFPPTPPLTMFFAPPDISGGDVDDPDMQLALQLIQNALFRM